MTVGEMVKTLKTQREIELRDRDGFVICRINSDSKGVKPYVNEEVTLWFPVKGEVPSLEGIDLVFYISEYDESEGKE